MLTKKEKNLENINEFQETNIGKGNYIVCMKSGISFSLTEVELYTGASGSNRWYFFKKGGEVITSLPHSEDIVLDDVIDLIVKTN
jgi:hypothetical protein